ncbi:MAG: hypothetical protein JO104_07405, partial [Candidatus Eremiobacteraeota bacterium]|nr:hypothetical protein [Candidatus Eremiobacteraeota bacterium]
MFKPETQTRRTISGVLAATVLAGGCAGGYGATPPAAPAGTPHVAIAADISPDVSVLKQLTKQTVIGSTVDPVNGAQNPYGLTVAPITTGSFTKGDLVVCNFNAKSNVQGTGRSIVALHPVPKSKPTHVSSIKSLTGCDALSLDGGDTIWAAAMVANDNPVIDPSGKLVSNISGTPFKQPWG